MDADAAARQLTPGQRYLILFNTVLASSHYSTALLTTSTILPQMQGAMSATQDEIAWAMTFNILATAIVTPMTGCSRALRLQVRDGHRHPGVLHRHHDVRPRAITRSARHLAHRTGRVAERRSCRCRRRSCSTPSRANSSPWCCRSTAWPWASRRDRSGARRLSGGGLQLALGLPHARAHRLIGFVGLMLTLKNDRQGRVQLDWTGFLALTVANVRDPAGSGARRAPRLVPVDRNHCRVPDRRARLLRLRHPLPHGRQAVPQSTPAEGSQLRDRPRARDHLRHAQLHADGAAAAAAAAVRRLPGCARRRGDRRAGRGDDGGFSHSGPHEPHRSAHRHGRGLLHPDDYRAHHAHVRFERAALAARHEQHGAGLFRWA